MSFFKLFFLRHPSKAISNRRTKIDCWKRKFQRGKKGEKSCDSALLNFFLLAIIYLRLHRKKQSNWIFTFYSCFDWLLISKLWPVLSGKSVVNILRVQLQKKTAENFMSPASSSRWVMMFAFGGSITFLRVIIAIFPRFPPINNKRKVSVARKPSVCLDMFNQSVVK